MNLEDIMLSEINAEKPILYDLTNMWNLQESNSQKQSRIVVAEGCVVEMGRYWLVGINSKL